MPALLGENRSSRLAGSYRDPSGYVFAREGRIFRALDQTAAAALQGLEAHGALSALLDDGLLVATRFVADGDLLAELRAEHADGAAFLEHERLPTIAFPAEWSISMLADAAALTIDLQLRLLEQGCGLKDATAYNVQFRGSRPTFIDAASIERAPRRDVWHALGQFHRCFTYPLLLCRHHAWEPRDCFSSQPEGRTPEQTARIVGRWGLLRPRNWLDLSLPLLLAGRAKPSRSAVRSGGDSEAFRAPRLCQPCEVDVASSTDEAPSGNVAAQRWNLLRLRKKVLRLAAGYQPKSAWSDYAATCSYDEAAAAAKRDFVADCLRESRPKQVLDLGCNTGEYSLLAATHAEQVIAIDSDHDSVERFYRRLRDEAAPQRTSPAAITPLVVDLLAPTPAVGFRNAERPAFLSRVQPDCVLALAVAHHLLVRGNLTPAMLRDQLFDLTGSGLVLEFVPPRDPMFLGLLRDRAVGELHRLTLEEFRRTFAERFTVLREASLPHSCRTLLWLRKGSD